LTVTRGRGFLPAWPGGKTWRSLACQLAALAAGLVCAGVASAASRTDGWLPPTTIDTRNGQSLVSVADDGGGALTWGSTSAPARIAGGDWRPSGLPTLWGALAAAVSAPGGRAAAAWRGGNPYGIYAAARGSDGSWGAAAPLAMYFDSTGDAPAIAADARGDVTVLWAGQYSMSGGLFSSDLAAGSTTWSTPLRLSADLAAKPLLVADANGDLVAAWRGPAGLMSAARPSGGAWEQPVLVDASSSYLDQRRPDLVVDARGDAMLGWGNGPALHVAERSGGGQWSAPEPLPTVGYAFLGGVAIDDAGGASALWSDDSGVHVSQRPAGTSAWGTPTTLAGSGLAESIAADAAGDAIAVWQTDAATAFGTSHAIWASRQAAGGPWTTGATISAAGENAWDASLALDRATGDATAVWIGDTSGTGDSHVRAAGYSASPPQITLTLPTAHPPGTPLTFTAQVRQVWPSDTTMWWTLGDGTTLEGFTVQHAYATPGSYTVTASAGDSIGHSTTVSGTVLVPAPAPAVRLVRLVVPARLRAGRPLAVRIALSTPGTVTLGLRRLTSTTAHRHVVVHASSGTRTVRLSTARLGPGPYRLDVRLTRTGALLGQGKLRLTH
jgi:hypothetical protein